MTSVRTFTARAARLIATTLVATIACAVVAPNATPAKAAGANIIDYFATTSSTKYFSATDNSTFDSMGDFTVEAWVKPDTACIAASECTIATKEMSWIVGIISGKLSFALANSSGGNWTYQVSTFPMIANTWQHVSYTISRSTNTMTGYVNGSLAHSLTSSSLVPSPGFNNGNSFYIGTRHNGSTPYSPFTGSIDEVRLYSNIRSQANIQSDMNLYGTAATADTTGLVLYYDFNEGSGTSLGNTVTSPASGTNLTASSAPTWSDVQSTITVENTTYTAFPRSYLTANGGYTLPSQVKSFDYLVVAGGGGGGSRHGGGGGAGGYLTANNISAASGDKLQITVGAGGLGHLNSTTWRAPSNGTNSVLSRNSVALATAIGGGAGAGSSAASGGSGGGGNNVGVFGNGTAGQGNNGGTGADSYRCTGAAGWCGGGGGGAGGVGENADNGNNNRAGNGGVGLASSLLTTSVATTLGIGHVVGSSVFFAGGGGGGIDSGGTAGIGGNGGGANGTAGYGTTFFNGAASTGGGGGGGGYQSLNTEGGAGGSGVVLLVYRAPVSVSTSDRSRRFTGVSTSNVSINDNNLLDFTMDITAEAWIYPTDTSCSGNKTFMGKENSYIFAVCNNFISFALRGISGTTWAWYQTTIPVTINTWAHFAFVRTSGRLTIYKNGGTAAGGSEFTTTTGVPTDAFFNSSDSFVVGGRPGCTTECFTGYIDDVRLWSYPRSPGAIAQNYNKHVAADVLYFPFDESVGTTVANHAPSTGSTLNGTATTTAAIENAWPTSSSTYAASNLSGFLPGYDYQAGGAVTFAISQNGAKGTATVSASTGAFSYEANAGATGNDTFTYSVTGASGSATYTYTVTAPSQPMASSKTFKQNSDVAATLNSATSLGYNNPSTAFTNGETVRATLSVTNGTVNLTQSGTAIASGSLNSSSVTIDGTQSQINTALNTATVTATSATPTRVTLDIGMKPVDQTISSRTYTYNSNGHFYTRIASGTTTWTSSDTAAKAMSLGGRPGYLATIQNAAENSTVAAVNGANNSWIGTTDTDVDGTFRWKGNDTNSIFRIGANKYRSRYENWNTGEPNGGTSENFGMMRDNGTWNDCPNSCGTIGSIVEFDPMSSRTVTNLDFARSLTATATSARNLGLGTAFLSTSTWANGETVRATFTASAGSIAYTAGSTTLVSGASGSSTVTFEGSVANMNIAFNTVTVTPTAIGNSTVTFTYGVKRVTTGSYVYNAVSDHFYFSNSTTATYATTLSNASNAKWAGTSGYPVSITSESEYNTVRRINSLNSWSSGSDTVSEGQFAWDAPDAYQIFF